MNKYLYDNLDIVDGSTHKLKEKDFKFFINEVEVYPSSVDYKMSFGKTDQNIYGPLAPISVNIDPPTIELTYKIGKKKTTISCETSTITNVNGVFALILFKDNDTYRIL